MNKKYVVYMHTNKINNKKYIGITCQKLLRRFRSDGSGYEQCFRFWKAIQKYGWENFEHEVLFEDLTQEEAEQKEIELISFYNTTNPKFGYNICLGGNLMSQESINKMAKTKTGIPASEKRKQSLKEHWAVYGHPWQGKCHSDETKALLSQKTCEQIAKQGNPMLGKKHTNESNIQNMLSQPTRKTVQQIDIGTGEVIAIYPSQSQAAKAVGATVSGISFCCKGKYSTCKGYKWQYA